MADEYNPLDYKNLTKNCIDELMRRGPYSLPLDEFSGAGVYALFYIGQAKIYAKVRAPKADWPLYVGKAVPPGARKGAGAASKSKALHKRLMEHTASIDASDLDLKDFLCRHLVVTPLWITMAERFLIETFQPAWNICVEGFGNHNPGSGRYQGEITWWDALHPGRVWATKLRQTRSQVTARTRLTTFLRDYQLKRRVVTDQTLENDDEDE